MNNWYVITGGPSSGKTTLITELDKLGYKTVPESARVVIDEALRNGILVEELRRDEKKFQEIVAERKREVEANLDKDEIIFFDRGMHDTLAYMRAYDFPVKSWIKKLHDEATYRKVFLLDPLLKYEKDYARVENDDFVEKIGVLLHDVYTSYGMKPEVLPPTSVQERIQCIIDSINERQR